MKTPQVTAYFKNLFDRYKYILLVCVAGVLLMVWPQDHETADQQPICDTKALLLGWRRGFRLFWRRWTVWAKVGCF